MKIVAHNYVSKDIKSLKGTVDLEILEIGLAIRDVMIMETNGKKWLAYPQRKYQNADGKTCYYSYIWFKDAEQKNTFDMRAWDAIVAFVAKQSEERRGKTDPTDPVEFTFDKQEDDLPF